MRIAKPISTFIRLSTICLMLLPACAKKPTGPDNRAPAIRLSVANLSRLSWNSNEEIEVTAVLEDDGDTDSLQVQWSATGGAFTATASTGATWKAPAEPGNYLVRARVTDVQGARGADSLVFVIGNRPPNIMHFSATSNQVIIGNTLTFRCTAVDSDGHDLSYAWRASSGRIAATAGDSMQWIAPETPGEAEIVVVVSDPFAASAKDTALVAVYREAGSVWVADVGNKQIAKLSAEGAELLRLSGFSAPQALAVDPRRRRLWIADAGADQLFLYDVDGSQQNMLDSLGGPADVAVYWINGRAWLAEADSGRIIEISNDGSRILRQCRGFVHPAALAVDQKTGDVWVADGGNHLVVHLSRDFPNQYDIRTGQNFHESLPGFISPADLEIDFQRQVVWIVDNFDGQIYRIEKNQLSRVSISGLKFPESLSADVKNAVAWIADTGNGRALKLDSDRIVAEVNGLLLPYALAIDPNNGHVWVADTENDRVVKISPEGTKLLSVYGFSSPRALVVNPGQ